MKLTILGSGTSIIKKDRLAPGYLVELNLGESFLFDCGGTVSQQFANINFDYTKLDHILISHPHPDHLGGLISFLHAIKLKLMYGKFFNQKVRTKILFIHGYPGFLKDYRALGKMMSPEKMEPKIEIIEHGNSRKKYSDFILQTKIVPHAEKYFKSLAFRLEAENKIFVYSGDSRYCENLIKLAKGADLFLCDACSMEKGLGGGYHLTPQGAGAIAQKAGVKKLVLTHHYDIMTPKQILSGAKKYFSGEIVLAKDLMKFKI